LFTEFTDTQTHRHRHTQTHTYRERETDRQSDRQTDRHRDRNTERDRLFLLSPIIPESQHWGRGAGVEATSLNTFEDKGPKP
jgi:Ni/Co efflux regulator RcnB